MKSIYVLTAIAAATAIAASDASAYGPSGSGPQVSIIQFDEDEEPVLVQSGPQTGECGMGAHIRDGGRTSPTD
ncbi:MAG: hypothetical protein HS101_19965 [Planctomycetia bacterium]|nr:hypothetical protein [Planctomycetia bacterium]